MLTLLRDNKETLLGLKERAEEAEVEGGGVVGEDQGGGEQQPWPPLLQRS